MCDYTSLSADCLENHIRDRHPLPVHPSQEVNRLYYTFYNAKSLIFFYLKHQSRTVDLIDKHIPANVIDGLVDESGNTAKAERLHPSPLTTPLPQTQQSEEAIQTDGATTEPPLVPDFFFIIYPSPTATISHQPPPSLNEQGQGAASFGVTTE